MPNITIRRETSADHRAVENLTREAFWDGSNHLCDEHLLVTKLRKCPEFIPELDSVAELNGQIVGSIFYTAAAVIGDDGREFGGIITFGPLSVLPAFQGQGIGGALARHTADEARKMGYRGIIIFGHPDYYPRLGFSRAYEYNIFPHWGAKDFDPLMALPLYEGAFEDCRPRR